MPRFNTQRTINIGGSVTRSKYGGFQISIDGLEALGADVNALAKGGVERAIRRSLRGAGGEALAAEQRLRAPKRTGQLVSGIGVHLGGRGLVAVAGDVHVGYVGSDGLPRGEWAESGVKPHFIQPRASTSWRGVTRQEKHALHFNGEFYANAFHPGYRGRKVASRSMKAAEWEIMADIVDEIHHELAAGKVLR